MPPDYRRHRSELVCLRVPGTLKNGLDWVVGADELVGKPVTLFNASSRGMYAQSSLTETLNVMSAKVVSEASITLQLLGRPFSADQIAADSDMSAALRAALESFASATGALFGGSSVRC